MATVICGLLAMVHASAYATWPTVKNLVVTIVLTIATAAFATLSAE